MQDPAAAAIRLTGRRDPAWGSCLLCRRGDHRRRLGGRQAAGYDTVRGEVGDEDPVASGSHGGPENRRERHPFPEARCRWRPAFM